MMKYNLKTYPQEWNCECDLCYKRQIWKVGFEKELRTLDDVEHIISEYGSKWIRINEILGEK